MVVFTNKKDRWRVSTILSLNPSTSNPDLKNVKPGTRAKSGRSEARYVGNLSSSIFETSAGKAPTSTQAIRWRERYQTEDKEETTNGNKSLMGSKRTPPVKGAMCLFLSHTPITRPADNHQQGHAHWSLPRCPRPTRIPSTMSRTQRLLQ